MTEYRQLFHTSLLFTLVVSNILHFNKELSINEDTQTEWVPWAHFCGQRIKTALCQVIRKYTETSDYNVYPKALSTNINKISSSIKYCQSSRLAALGIQPDNLKHISHLIVHLPHSHITAFQLILYTLCHLMALIESHSDKFDCVLLLNFSNLILMFLMCQIYS